MRAALEFLLGDESAETLAALRGGFIRYAAHDGAGSAISLNRYIGLPVSPAKIRLTLRDQLLRQAGALIEAPTPWIRAGVLAEAVRCFERRKWRLGWRHLEEPPLRATAMEALLFRARGWAEFPQGQRQLNRILL